MRRTLLLAAIGLVVSSVLAGPEILPVRGVKHATYDWASGELIPGTTEPRYGASVWASIQFSGYYFIQMYHGTGATALDWGDIAGPQEVGGFSFAYATHSVLLPETVDVVIALYDDENGFNSVDRDLLGMFRIPNLPTADPEGQWNGWVVWVDLTQPGESFFTIDGSDLDGDRLMDIGYTYWFTDYAVNNPRYPHHYLGPMIAGDPNLIPPPAPGIEHAFDFFGDPNLNIYWGTYWFSGVPFMQTYMELFDSAPRQCREPGASGKYCFADIDGSADCVVDMADLARLLSNYETTSGATLYDGDLEPHPDGDGDVDLADLAELLSQYGDECGIPPLFDAEGFEDYELGPLAGQDGWRRQGSSHGTAQVVEDPTGQGHGKVIELNLEGSEGERYQVYRDIVWPGKPTVVIEWDQYRADLADDMAVAMHKASRYAWHARQRDGRIHAHHLEGEGIPLRGSQWQHVTCTLGRSNFTATVTVGDEQETVHVSPRVFYALHQIALELERWAPAPDRPMYIDNVVITELE